MSLGTYRPHTFFISIENDAELNLLSSEADPNLEIDAPFDCAVPTHVHEYVHFLHNISTGSGLNCFRANLWLVRLLRDCSDVEGRVVRQEPHEAQLKNLLNAAAEWNEVLYGKARWVDLQPPENVRVWTFKTVHRKQWKINLSDLNHSVELVTIDVEAQTRDGIVNGSLDIGYDFISEGVAYEVERGLYCANGKQASEINKTVQAYPYLAFEALLEHLVGRPTTVIERIQLGVCSLMCTSPAEALFDLAESLRQHQGSKPLSEGLPSSIVDGVFDQFKENPLAILAMGLASELEDAFTGDMADAAIEVKTLFQSGLALRGVNPFLESGFLQLSLGRDQFLAHVGGLLVDCCIRQKKQNGEAELQWIGSGLVGTDDKSMERIGVLQAAIHYATRHLHNKKFLLTAELPSTSCPFSGACKMEKEDGKPNDCTTRPWNRFRRIPKGQPKCWYATAVDLFRAHSK